MKQVVFRVDASAQCGSGHFARAVALGHILKARGCKVHFICRRLPDVLRPQADSAGIGIIDLPPAAGPEPAASTGYEHWLGTSWREDARQTLAAIDTLGSVDWLVVDHYGIDSRWQSQVRSATRSLLVIDDLADRRHECNILLNHNFLDGGGQRYATLVSSDVRLLLGPGYAPLREEFSRERRDLSRDTGRASHILVSLGGADPQGTTMRVLEAVTRLGAKDVRVTAVLGGLNPHRDEIERKFRRVPNVELRRQVVDMAALMVDADLAVGAGGISNWERCCLGLPSLVVSVAQNQIEPAEMTARKGACVYLGEAADLTGTDLHHALSELLGSEAQRGKLSQGGLALVDGRGCERIADEMLATSLKVRRARSDDAQRVFPWRNDEQTRLASRDPRPLTFESHRNWFSRALGDPGRVLLIGEDLQGPLGVLRYDLHADAATVSIYLDPARRGRGYGRALLRAGEQWLRRHRAEVKMLIADVLPDNARSRRTFESAGFRPAGQRFEKLVDRHEPSETKG